MELKFQESLNNRLLNITLDSLPNPLILLGKNGCGRHSLIKLLSEKFNIEAIDITEKLCIQYITDLQLCVDPKIVYINCDKLLIKQQNIILKFLEQPIKNIYIILVVENKNRILNTVLSRCQIWQFSDYTKQQLQQYTDNELILKYAETPGQCIQYQAFKLDGLEDYCYKLLTLVSKATVPNTLFVASKLNFDNDSSKYDFRLFYKCLYDVCFKLCKENLDYLAIYKLTSKLIVDSSVQIAIDQKRLFENYLINLKSLADRLNK